MIAKRTFGSALHGPNSRFIPADLETGGPGLNVGFLLLEHFSLLAFTQALDALVTANLIQPGAFSHSTCSLDSAALTSDLAILIGPSASLSECVAQPLDLLVICGGLRTPLTLPEDLATNLQELARRKVALAGLWNGAWFLGRAGLLDGYRCAVHPEHRAALAEIARHGQVSSEAYCIDRDRLSAASPAGALSMMLEWIGQRRGPALAEGITAILAFESSRYRRTTPAAQANISEPLREAITLMSANLEEPLSQDQLAAYVGRSKRQIGRLFQRQLNTTPVRYYLELRITESRRLLQHSDLPIMDVAVACGFVSASHFSKCYRSFFGYGPSREKRQGCVKGGRRPASHAH